MVRLRTSHCCWRYLYTYNPLFNSMVDAIMSVPISRRRYLICA